jgi:glycerol-3-phosphate dehydrogenase
MLHSSCRYLYWHRDDGAMTPNREQSDQFDVIVIGGGINGTSAARELSASGYRVLLAEQADLANGASSRSSRILHCGLRYFETERPVRTFARSPSKLLGAIRMAKAAMEARAELVRAQPARCKPFTMCFPLYRGEGISGWHLDAGFALLKRLGPSSPPLGYRRVSGAAKTSVPFVGDLRDQSDLVSIATYREYMIDWPDRICVDAALDAERTGSAIRLFTKARLRERTAGGEWLVELGGGTGDVDLIRAPLVLNLAGTWIDDVCLVGGSASGSRLIRGTKGSHIVVRLPERYRGHGVAALHRGGMPFYCLPLDGDRFFFGPTETPFDGDASEARPTGEEIDFLLGEATHLLPGLRLTRRDVEFSWAGVRPLTYDPEQPMGRRTREIHDLGDRGFPGVLAMSAGPVMTHMSAGRELRDAVARRLRPSRPAAAGATSRLDVPDDAEANLPRDAFRRAVSAEHARDLPGILYTRTAFAWGRHLDRDTVEEAATSVADLLGWNADEVSRRVSEFLAHQQRMFPTAPGANAGSPAEVN